MKTLLFTIVCISVLSWAGLAEACDPESLTNFLNSNICPMCDLSGCSLARKDLRGARLWRANLEGANLQGARLEGAFLVGVNFEGANLSGANLIGSDLLNANLSGADLSGASLDTARWVDGSKCSLLSTGKCEQY